MAHILRCKIHILTCLILFMLGNGFADACKSAGMFITGWTIQKPGVGKVYVLINIMQRNLAALQVRGKYVGIINA